MPAVRVGCASGEGWGVLVPRGEGWGVPVVRVGCASAKG